jgi:hypothetical protein
MAVSLKAKSAPGRGCECCPDLPRKGMKDKMRRTTRRVEKREWKKGY